MRSPRAAAAVLIAFTLMGSPGCFWYRWGTPHGVALPDSSPATDLVVLVEDPVVADVCERLDVFGRVDRALDPWPAAGATPHAPDAWLEVAVEDDAPDPSTRASLVYTVVTFLPFVASLGHACPLVVVRNHRLLVSARAGRDDDPWVRGEEVERVEVRYREGRVLWGLIAGMTCHKWLEPAPPEILEGALRLIAGRLAERRRVAGASPAAPSSRRSGLDARVVAAGRARQGDERGVVGADLQQAHEGPQRAADRQAGP